MLRASFTLAAVVALALASSAAARPSRADRGATPKASLQELDSLTREELISRLLERDGNFADAARASNQVYWWKFPEQDCAYDDVDGSCTGKTVSECEDICTKTTGCGGFNYPHGILKKTDCIGHLSSSPTVDTYVMQNKPQPPPPPPAVNFPPIWPRPMSFTNGSANVTLDASNFKFTTNISSPDMDLAFERYAPLCFPHRTSASPGQGALTSIEVNVGSSSGILQLETDETYTLTIPSTGGKAVITAPTVFGAFHGLETFSQLINFNFDTQEYVIAAAPWNINDKPRFHHREVLLDSSRHFEPVTTIKNVVDSLTFAKMNVIHWHIVDEQSFPFMPPSLPELGAAGSYSPYERFTAEDVADVVEYARARGVRIMIEIDTPGHAAAMCKAHPEICPSPTCTMPLNPATNATFDVLSTLFKDITGGARGKGLVPDNMMHLGGDEVNTNCWTTTASVASWLQEHNLTADGGYEYFVNRVQEIAIGYGRDVVGWEEIWNHFGTKLNKATIIHQWLPGSTVAVNATANGYRVLWSTDGVWYLDGLSTTWETMYVQEPCTGIPDNLCDTLVLGGGGEMWGETVDTSDIEQTIWPRLGAIAERLWSPRNINSTDEARQRFYAFRCLLNRRGVAAAPSGNGAAREAPSGPGGCYVQ